MLSPHQRFYPIVDELQMLEVLARLGYGWIQLRRKDADTAWLRQALQTHRTHRRDETQKLILNDDLAAAMALGFDGVHLGQEDLQHSHADLKIVTAKKLLLGVSTHSLDEIDTALRLCTPDYVAIGPWNATPNKPYLAAPGHTALRACLQHLKTDHPQCLTVGIGGIHLMNAEQLFGYGLDILAGISLANELATADESRPDACL